MKKKSIRFFAAVMIISTINCFGTPVNKINIDAPKAPTSTNLFVGTWQLCKSDSSLNTDLGGQAGNCEYKILTGESFTVIKIDNNQKVFTGVFTGTYTVKDNIYTETIQYSHPQVVNNVGVTNSFKFEVKNGYLIIKGINNPYNEIWKKIKE